ncbi:unnamed protein product [Darwinula stevensoni]|uniref:Nuclear protein MDM1 n=1 Tax=Darwinula stevensoni TaxID=69355 RepID=A0A7R8XFH5_9CRUS|nr:unnamed protein product [Darwinula stevensoni]CAG0891604.1 unnamed protein product [Darwinula stevensoni]
MSVVLLKQLWTIFSPYDAAVGSTHNHFSSVLLKPKENIPEPVFPRRRKHPELAYNTSPWYGNLRDGGHQAHASSDALDSPPQSNDRARSTYREDRESAGRRSRSEGPQNRSLGRLSFLSRPPPFGCDIDFKIPYNYPPPARSAYVPKESSEYALQYCWPRSLESTPRKTPRPDMVPDTPRKSQSLSLIGADQATGWRGMNGQVTAGTPTQDTSTEKVVRRKYKSEYSKKFRPFSAYQYVDGQWRKAKGDPSMPGEEDDNTDAEASNYHGHSTSTSVTPISTPDVHAKPWYAEVSELRKQAGQYRCRGWGTGLTSEHMAGLYKEQAATPRRSSITSTYTAAILANKSDRESPKREKGREKEKEKDKEKEEAEKEKKAKPKLAPKPRPPRSAAKPGPRPGSSEGTTKREPSSTVTGTERKRPPSAPPKPSARTPLPTKRLPTKDTAQKKPPVGTFTLPHGSAIFSALHLQSFGFASTAEKPKVPPKKTPSPSTPKVNGSTWKGAQPPPKPPTSGEFQYHYRYISTNA